MPEIELLLLVATIASIYTGCKVQAIAKMMAENQKRDLERRARELERMRQA